MFKNASRTICACALSATFVLAAPPQNGHANLSTFVVVGDSLSAGVQNFSLLDTQQPHGYASLIATQANTPLPLPLVPYPGAPNVLQLISLNPLTIQPVAGSLPFPPRDNPLQPAYNISVPGVTVADALLVPSEYSNTAVQGWGDIVLGFPALLEGQNPKSQVATAVALKPTTVIEWLGNNDALVPALVGVFTGPNGLTPLLQFAASYDQVLDKLSATGATLITANIPDVTKVPYFTSVPSIAAGICGTSAACVDGVAKTLGIGPGDYVRLSGLPVVDSILSTGQGSLQGNCPSPLAALTTSPIPCVLTAKDAAALRLVIDSYNAVIAIESLTHGALMVDIHTLVDQISANGYSIGGGKTLTTSFLGGLFSLDGIHPTNTGYGIIANTFIQAMNGSLKTNLAPVNVPAIAATDPLVF